MILTIKLNKDTSIHDLQRLTKDLKDMYEIDVSLSHTYDVMELKVSKQVSILDLQEIIGTCGELYVDIGFMDEMMDKVFNPSTYTTTGNIFSEAIKDLNTKGINI